MIVRIGDVRAAGYCVQGARRWAESHGIDFKDFLRDGIDAEVLRQSGDGLALRLLTQIEASREVGADGRR